MASSTRQDWNDTRAERLAEAVQALAGERDIERMCELALDAAIDLAGAAAGHVATADGAGGLEVRAGKGAPGEGPGTEEPLTVTGERVGAIVLWGADEAARPALRVLATQLSQGFANVEMERRAAQQRGRARRFAEAVRALRGVQPTEQAVLCLVDEARKLVAGAASALVTGLPGDPGPAVSLGLDPESERLLAGIVAGELSSLVAHGRPWAGPVPVDVALREQGLVGLALVPVGDENDRIGTLAVLTRDEAGVTLDELEALWSLADHATAALGAAALRERLDELGTVDPATRFFNARYFTTRLEQETHRALRSREGLSLAIFGIDGLAQLRAAAGDRAAEDAVSALAEHLVPRLRA
ncbi:MAG: hypothetical protein U0237_15925, partial [Thermoleophilia bacterium]